MAAFEGHHNMPASLAVVQNAGALSLELPMEFDMQPYAPGVAGSPVAMSPWACSTEACGSPWSPVTPAVLPLNTKAPARSPRVSMSPFFLQSPTVPEGKAQTFPVQTLPAVGMPQLSPTSLAQVAASPTTQIRRNAVSFGIPLNAKTCHGEVSAPLPVRTTAGMLVPSPTTRGSGAPLVAVPPFGGGGVATVPGVGAAGMATVLRSIATPLTSHPRRAAGGA
mmetsp:Transcript_22715/g.65484  ORF Transcript_22715/g.65484 Transcript_22715/m.65484 type:complete len:222 (+) Transcript_22715:158-823(+)